jgi:hypothetical protein
LLERTEGWVSAEETLGRAFADELAALRVTL